MTARVWHTGSPPHIGWWQASSVEDIFAWRWWDGEGWSSAVFNWGCSTRAAECAKVRVSKNLSCVIKWTHFWPVNARVPRTDPNKLIGILFRRLFSFKI